MLNAFIMFIYLVVYTLYTRTINIKMHDMMYV